MINDIKNRENHKMTLALFCKNLATFLYFMYFVYNKS